MAEVLFALPSIPFFAMVVWEHISDRAPDAARRPLRIALRSAEEKTRCHKKAEFPSHDTLRFKENQLSGPT